MRFWKAIFVVILVAGSLIYFLKSGQKSETKHETEVTATPTTEKSEPSSARQIPQLPPPSLKKLNQHDQHQFSVLQEILLQHNDNDPRFDTELTHLSPELKKVLVEHYAEIPLEKRNDRGTIVFLIGREIASPSDLGFMKSVLMEKPCQSLEDCGKAGAPASGEAEHLQGINETTANYPQLNSTRALVSSYRDFKGRNPQEEGLAEQVIQTLQEATHSPNPKVVQEAENALRYLGR